MAEVLENLPGVSLGDQVGSPFQPDLRLRGFSVSPVVGLPQSISVFVDGVRVNEADASQVHFNLLPMRDLERVELVRGPAGNFGKNSLAGALNLVTRRGLGDSQVELEVFGGDFGVLFAEDPIVDLGYFIDQLETGTGKVEVALGVE